MSRSRLACCTVLVATLVITSLGQSTGAAAAATAVTATKIVISTPGGAVGGASFTTQPVVTFQDNAGTTATSSAAVTLSITSGTGTTGAALTGCTPAASGGVVTYTGCSIDKSGTGYKITATSGSFTATTGMFAVTVGTAAKVVFTTPPADIVAGNDFTSTLTLAVQDTGGNVVTGYTSRIGLAVVATGDTGPLVCSGGEDAAPAGKAPGYKVAAVSGVAAFPLCKINKAGGAYVLVAAAPDGTTNASGDPGAFIVKSSAFAVTAGSASKLAFTTQPTGATGSAAFTSQPVVAFQDAGGNPVTTPTGVVTLSIKAGTGTAGAALSCAPVAAVAGVATFAGCSVDKTGTGYVLSASSAGLSGLSGDFIVSVGNAAHVTFTSQPGATTGGVALGGTPTVAITDGGGGLVSGSVQLTLSGGPSGAVLSCPNNPASAGSGSVVVSGCTVDKAGTYQLVATEPDVAGLSATSNSFTVSVGTAARLGFVANPVAATGGTAFSTQPSVAVQDLGGNPVPVTNESVQLAISTGVGAAGAHLTCTANPVTTSTGTAAFAGCAIDKAGAGYQLTATGHGFVATSATFAVTAGPAARLAFKVTPTTSIVASIFGSQPQVSVVDAGGNPLPTASATVTIGATGPGTLQCETNPLATVGGIAGFSRCQLSASGLYTLTAAASGLAPSTSSSFTVKAGSPLGAAPVGEPLGQTFGGGLYDRNVTATVNSVNSATGALSFNRTDLTVAGIGEPFTLTRQYNSLDTAGGLFGPGWSSIFDAGVQIAANGQTALVRGEDGQQVIFVTNGSGGWSAPAGARATLVCSGTTCTVTRYDGVSWHSRGGHIQDFLARTGQGLHLTYSGTTLTGVSVQLASGTLPITVNVTGGLISSILTPTRSVSYSYTAGSLTGYSDAKGETWHYVYGAGLTQEIDPLAKQRLLVTYAAGRVASAIAMGGPKHFSDTYSWNATTQVSSRTAKVVANGVPAVGVYLDQYKNNVLVSQQQPDGATSAYSYDGQRNLLQSQDPLGRIQSMAYSAAGDLITQTTQYSATASAISRIGYNAAHRTTSTTDATGYTTNYAYTGANQTSMTPPGAATGATRYLYNTLGQQTEMDTPTGIKTFTYDNAGNQTGFRLLDLHRVALNGLGPISTFDESGNRLVAADARGHNSDGSTDPDYRTTNTYDPNGQLLTATAPGPNITTTTYTDAGDVASTTLAGQPTTTFAWNEATLTRTSTSTAGTSKSIFDPSGNVLSEVDPGGRTTSHRFDTTSRVTSMTDPGNVTSTYTSDLEGNIVSTVDSDGHSETITFDPQNRPVRTIHNGITVTSTYDPAGNVVGHTDGAGRSTTYTFNTHQKMATVKTAAGTTSYGYDASDNLTSVKDGAGHTTLTSYNGAGQKTATTVSGHTTTYGYDVASNLTSVTDPDGRKATYGLDALNLRTAITYTQSGQPSIAITQSFNSAGLRTSMTDPTTGTHTYAYDTSGNLTSAVNGADTFTWDYTQPGKVLETYPDGSVTTTAYDDSHNVMSVQATGVNVSYLRNTARQVTGMAYSNGIVETQAYDQAGNVINQSLSCAGTDQVSTAYAYDAAGNPLGRKSTLGGTTTTTSYGYDASSRLSAQSTTSTGTATNPNPTPSCTSGTQSGVGAPQGNDGSGGLADPPAPAATVNQPGTGLGFASTGTTANPVAYDAVGNRLSGGGATYTYDTADRVLSQTGAAWSYDGAGNVTKIGVKTFAYDAGSRLVKVVNGAVTTTYTYDGDGNRVSSDTGGTKTRYSWDTSGTVALLALERTDGGTLIRRYLYGVAPIAMQTPTATFYYHTGPTGDVNQLSDSTGAIVASYTYDGFGNVTTRQITPTVVANPLLYKGEYFDAATGLYNMRARNYDPTNGRFTQRDPLAPQVGTPVVSAYAFVANRPTVASDPTGQAYSYGDFEHDAFDGKSTESADIANDAGYGVKVLSFAIKAQVLLTKYATEALEASAKADAALAGKVLAVIGIGLALYVAIETCRFGPVEKCVGETVGVAISIGCLAISSGAGSLACSIIGAGIAYAISNYGPQMVEGLVQFGGLAAEGGTIAINAISDGFNMANEALSGPYATASAAVTGAYESAATAVTGAFAGNGPIATGFESLGSAISSGYASAIGSLEQAGYTAVQMATVLAETFGQGLDTVVNELANLAYDVVGVANALADVFNETAAQAAALLQDLEYSITQLGDALNSAYEATAAAAGAILQGLDYAVGEIAGVLNGVFDEIDSGVAEILQGLNYAIDDIATGLQSAFNYATDEAAQAVTSVFLALTDPYTFTEIAGALQSVFDATDQTVAQVFDAVSATASQIAVALESAFNDAAGEVATLLKGVGFAVDVVAGALESAYNATAQVAAEALKFAGYIASEIEGVLSDLFGQTVDEILSVLGAIGFDDAAIRAIGGAFEDFGNAVADAFESLFDW